VPYLTGIRTVAPGGRAYPDEFIETGGFSANSQEMLFTSDLTNFSAPSSPGYFGRTVYATAVNTSNWGPGGSYFYGDAELSLVTSASDILRVTLTCR